MAKWKRATLRDLHVIIRVNGGVDGICKRLSIYVESWESREAECKLMESVDRQVGY